MNVRSLKWVMLLWPAWAIGAPTSVPITIESDTAQYDYHDALMIHKGHVVVEWQDHILHADTLTLLKSKEGSVNQLSAEGKPASFEGVLATDKSRVNGKANLIEYFPDTKEIKLTGNAELHHHQDVFTGPMITFFLNSNSVVAHKSEQHRPKLVFEEKIAQP
jgi:lipopolysaccharide transport protein LptA